MPTPPPRPSPPPARALRAIAGFEALKGALALAAGMGLLGLAHHDLHRVAVALIGHVGLDPGAHYPSLLLSRIDLWAQADLRPLLAAVSAYAAVRFLEAYGLWTARAWGEWLGALSGALYIPFELRHWLHHPTLAATAVIALNAVVVGYLGWRLWARREAAPPA
ncbi:DUF2127 domain-containing protein [Paracidovorax anthurii]|uniref:Uncharacterized membrane protein (DUF2068 family) n=1 Tax=Paracidovorax anthurii TaxID=78229 RepID=A0A328ZG15_9BURK|nr:DUF2127 domain-containing protein [Paracidovorax anthurii]RAR85148.1 uncharacterized membrane protein (DUF2068 family) [Paracidovorax anthurii]